MKSLNKCAFIGNLGSAPEVRYTADGTAVANVSIACTEKWKDGEHTEWVKLVFWARLAEIVQEYCKKGDPIYVEGSARTRKWQDQSGKDNYVTEYRVSELIMLGKASKPEQPKPQQQEAPLGDGGGGDFDDIPFAPVDWRAS